jgi:hypothetical protein
MGYGASVEQANESAALLTERTPEQLKQRQKEWDFEGYVWGRGLQGSVVEAGDDLAEDIGAHKQDAISELFARIVKQQYEVHGRIGAAQDFARDVIKSTYTRTAFGGSQSDGNVTRNSLESHYPGAAASGEAGLQLRELVEKHKIDVESNEVYLRALPFDTQSPGWYVVIKDDSGLERRLMDPDSGNFLLFDVDHKTWSEREDQTTERQAQEVREYQEHKSNWAARKQRETDHIMGF